MKRLVLIVKGAVLAAALLLAFGLGLRATVDILGHPLTGEEGPPRVHLDSLDQEFRAAAAKGLVRVEFPVANQGERRLVIRSLRRPCCDGNVPEPTVVAPGRSGCLVLDVDAASLLKRGQHTEGFATNDPSRPEFWLTVRLADPAAPPTAAGANARSVLVQRP
jgi:hypothetical protein